MLYITLLKIIFWLLRQIWLPRVHCILVMFCMNLGHHKGTKVTELNFWKESGRVTNRGKKHFWGILDVFFPYLCVQSLEFSEISYTLSNTKWMPNVQEKFGFDCIVGTSPYFWDLFSTICQYWCNNLNNLKFGQDILYLQLFEDQR